MNSKRGSERKVETVLLRLQPSEKRAFQEAARASGLKFASWARERLRRAAIRDLEEVGAIPEFLKALISDE